MLNVSLLERDAQPQLQQKKSNKQQIFFNISLLLITISCILNTIFNSLVYTMVFKTLTYFNTFNITNTDIHGIIHDTYDLENCINNLLGPVCSR